MIALPLDLVRIEKFSEMTGYTPSAVRGKIASGDWREGHQFIKAPDGHILISLEGYHKWAEGQVCASGETPSSLDFPANPLVPVYHVLIELDKRGYIRKEGK